MELDKAQIKRSQNASIMDGAFWSVMVGAGENFLTAFGLALGAAQAGAAWITAVPQLVASFVQLLAVPISNSIRGRQLWVFAGAFLQALVWIPIAMLAWQSGWQFAVPALVLLYCAYLSLGTLLNPIWSAWMAEIVPENERGEYFSKRNKIMIFITVVAATLAGWMLSHYAAHYAQGAPPFVPDAAKAPFELIAKAGPLGGYAMLFLIALIARLASSAFLLRMEDVPSEHGMKEKIGLIELLTSPAQHESRKFAAFIWFLMTATYIASPFITIYLLTDMKVDMFTFSIISIAGSVAKFITLPYWGRLSDRYGPRAAFITTGLMIPFVPLTYVFSRDIGIIILGELFSGLAWGGFEMACFNFVLGRAEKAHRTAAVAVYNLSKGTGLFFGTAIGIFLFGYFGGGTAIGSAFITLFALSAIARFAASAVFLPQFKEGSFGGMGMGKFMWQALAVNPTIGVARNMSRTFTFGTQFFHTSLAASENAAKDGLGLVIYAMKRSSAIVSKNIRLKKGL